MLNVFAPSKTHSSHQRLGRATPHRAEPSARPGTPCFLRVKLYGLNEVETDFCGTAQRHTEFDCRPYMLRRFREGNTSGVGTDRPSWMRAKERSARCSASAHRMCRYCVIRMAGRKDWLDSLRNRWAALSSKVLQAVLSGNDTVGRIISGWFDT